MAASAAVVGAAAAAVRAGAGSNNISRYSVYYLKKLSVIPDYRHNGYGKALIDHVRDYVKKPGELKFPSAWSMIT